MIRLYSLLLTRLLPSLRLPISLLLLLAITAHPTTSAPPLMSSPFHPSHRRTRSYSSLSTPCTSPAPQHPQWRSPSHRAHACPKTLPCAVHGASAPCAPARDALGLSYQPAEKWDVDSWRRGKRARRDRDPQSPSGDADMESSDEAAAGLPSPDHDRLIADSAWSGTVGLASTSDAFQFFNTRPRAAGRARGIPHPASDDEAMDDMQFSPRADGLARVQAAAFDDLRKSVEEAGEGFVRRMREFEAQRSLAGPAVASSASQRAFHRRGRKRPSPRTQKHFAFPPASAEHESSGIPDDDDESDVEILSSIASSSDDYPHSSPTKKRAVSLCTLNDIPYASQPQCLSSPVRPSGARFGRARSPSPIIAGLRGTSLAYSNSNSSDEDDDELRFDAQRPSSSSRARKVRRSRYSCDASSAESTPPSLSFSFTSNNSSLQSLALGGPTPVRRSPQPSSTSNTNTNTNTNNNSSTNEANHPLFRSVHRPRPCIVPGRSAKYTEKAVAALSLALANGAGSVTDYAAIQSVAGLFPTADATGDGDGDGGAGSLWN